LQHGEELQTLGFRQQFQRRDREIDNGQAQDAVKCLQGGREGERFIRIFTGCAQHLQLRVLYRAVEFHHQAIHSEFRAVPGAQICAHRLRNFFQQRHRVIDVTGRYRPHRTGYRRGAGHHIGHGGSCGPRRSRPAPPGLFARKPAGQFRAHLVRLRCCRGRRRRVFRRARGDVAQ
jgi:hypothetical protein